MRTWPLIALTVAVASPALADQNDAEYASVVSSVANMVGDSEAMQLASQHGLQILNLTWEDTGRYQGSAVGPNISDVTIEVVQGSGSQRQLALMPVIRFPNFQDKTADVNLDRFFLKVGNQSNRGQEAIISLRELLADPARYLSFPGKGHIKGGSLLAPRDSHALVSAQAAFLPVPQGGKATFHPVIFNYQSTAKNPAVLTILVTRQGTSVTIVDNARDSLSGSWGQRLFFNAAGQRAPLTAERLSDVMTSGRTSNGESAASLGDDANLLMLVQVPLRYRQRPRRMPAALDMESAAAPAKKAERSRRVEDDVEVAVLGHGELEGPFTELDDLTIERDPRFPVRVTVQFYQATSSARITSATMHRLAQEISRVYDKGDAIGSLVVPNPQDLKRTTNWDGVGPAPQDLSISSFPGLEERWRKGLPANDPRTVGVK
ncbi:MAG TPA: hypothetical protein VMK12_27740 [Anaeromyxobacteraceae bacterium]|nr:hypothetical protein [Anaeromyxobacteraceae bacterium]